MKASTAAAIGVGVVVVVGAAVLVMSSSSEKKPPEFSAGLRPPMNVGQTFLVTFEVPASTTNEQASALLHFVGSWGQLLGAAQFAPAADGRNTASVRVRVEVAQPNGPPSIPANGGELVPMAWIEVPTGAVQA